MEFRIEFTTPKIYGRGWNFVFKRDGLSLIDEVRKLKGSHILADEIITEEWGRDHIIIPLSEETARKSRHFANNSTTGRKEK